MQINSISNSSTQATNNTSKINSLNSKLKTLESQEKSIQSNTSMDADEKQTQIQTIEAQIQLIEAQIQEASSQTTQGTSKQPSIKEKDNGDEVREGVVVSASLKEKIEASRSEEIENKEDYFEDKKKEENSQVYTYKEIYNNTKVE